MKIKEALQFFEKYLESETFKKSEDEGMKQFFEKIKDCISVYGIDEDRELDEGTEKEIKELIDEFDDLEKQ